MALTKANVVTGGQAHCSFNHTPPRYTTMASMLPSKLGMYDSRVQYVKSPAWAPLSCVGQLYKVKSLQRRGIHSRLLASLSGIQTASHQSFLR